MKRIKNESYYKKAIMDCYPDLLDFNNYWNDAKKLFIEQGRKQAIKKNNEKVNLAIAEVKTWQNPVFRDFVGYVINLLKKLKEKNE